MIYDWMINVIGKKKTIYWLYSECERDECVMTHLSYHINYTVFFALPHGARALTIVTKFIANEPIVIGTLYVACRVNESYWLGIDFPVWNTNERIFIQTLTERKKNRWWCVKNVQIWLNGNCASNCMWCERHCEWMRQWSNAISKRNPWVFFVFNFYQYRKA